MGTNASDLGANAFFSPLVHRYCLNRETVDRIAGDPVLYMGRSFTCNR